MHLYSNKLLVLMATIILKGVKVECKGDKCTDYDVSSWAKDLFLQQCVIIEIGEGFCSLFLESKFVANDNVDANNQILNEYFLGVCQCKTFRSWKWCPRQTTKQRPMDCTFNEARANSTTDARVHRRFCDIDGIINLNHCSCNGQLAGHPLKPVIGFPTCYQKNLPVSLCAPRSVCGVARCAAFTANGIHSVKCDSQCLHQQPFCERLGPETSQPRVVTSNWTYWSSPECSAKCGKGYYKNQARCLKTSNNKPAADCLGPTTSSCPEDFKSCKMIRSVDKNNGLVAERILTECQSPVSCYNFRSVGKNKYFPIETEVIPNKDEWIARKLTESSNDELLTSENPILNALTWPQRKKRTHKKVTSSGRSYGFETHNSRRLLLFGDLEKMYKENYEFDNDEYIDDLFRKFRRSRSNETNDEEDEGLYDEREDSDNVEDYDDDADILVDDDEKTGPDTNGTEMSNSTEKLVDGETAKVKEVNQSIKSVEEISKNFPSNIHRKFDTLSNNGLRVRGCNFEVIGYIIMLYFNIINALKF